MKESGKTRNAGRDASRRFLVTPGQRKFADPSKAPRMSDLRATHQSLARDSLESILAAIGSKSRPQSALAFSRRAPEPPSPQALVTRIWSTSEWRSSHFLYHFLPSFRHNLKATGRLHFGRQFVISGHSCASFDARRTVLATVAGTLLAPRRWPADLDLGSKRPSTDAMWRLPTPFQVDSGTGNPAGV